MKQLYLLVILLFFNVHIFAQKEEASKLKEGSKAPPIAVDDLKGEKINIGKILKDNDKVLVCFLRPIWCPVCNRRTHELISAYDSLRQKGYEVIVVYPTPAATLKDYVDNLKIPFRVVSDYDEALYNSYMVEKSGKKFLKSIFTKDSMKKGKEGAKLYKGKKYPVAGDKHGPIIPADFVIIKDNVLSKAYYGEYNGDHLELDKL